MTVGFTFLTAASRLAIRPAMDEREMVEPERSAA